MTKRLKQRLPTVQAVLGFCILVFALVLGGPPAHAASSKQGLDRVKNQPKAPDFKLPSLSGKTRTLRDFRGQVVILNFWATWCPPCRAELPSMQRAWKRMKGKGIVMLAVHVGGKRSEVQAFVKKHRVGIPILHDVKSSVMTRWKVKAYPTTYIIDPNGRVVYKAVGERKWDGKAILKKIAALRR